MLGGKWLGPALVGLGVLLNNYVYLHDLVFDKHDGFVYVGGRSVLGIALAMAVIAAGVGTLLRRTGED